MDHGRKLYDGSLKGIRERFGGNRVLIAVLDVADLAQLPMNADSTYILHDLPPGVSLIQSDGPRFSLSFGRDALPAHELVSFLGGATVCGM